MKGNINLDRCEQVDLGLKLEEKKLKFDHVFDIKTPTRTYYLAADTENEMKSWVTCISRVCDLKCTSGEEDCKFIYSICYFLWISNVFFVKHLFLKNTVVLCSLYFCSN